MALVLWLDRKQEHLMSLSFEELGITTDPVFWRNWCKKVTYLRAQKAASDAQWAKDEVKRQATREHETQLRIMLELRGN